eukprot:754007-Hanusia_phi.AAC.4
MERGLPLYSSTIGFPMLARRRGGRGQRRSKTREGENRGARLQGRNVRNNWVVGEDQEMEHKRLKNDFKEQKQLVELHKWYSKDR